MPADTSPGVAAAVAVAVDAAFREEWGRIVATLIAVTGDWDLAEECAQDAFAMALQRWPEDGIPGRPGAWLTTTARNRAIDVLRRRAVGAAKLRVVFHIVNTEDGLVATMDSPDQNAKDIPMTSCQRDGTSIPRPDRFLPTVSCQLYRSAIGIFLFRRWKDKLPFRSGRLPSGNSRSPAT